MDKLTKLNIAMSIEKTYTSFMRNCIILFSLGLTIINLTKRRRTEKFFLSFIVMFSGILLGGLSSKEYYDRIKLIENGDYEKINLLSKTLKITAGIIFLFFILLCYKIANMNDKYGFINNIKKK
jgi:hypothetical protein